MEILDGRSISSDDELKLLIRNNTQDIVHFQHLLNRSSVFSFSRALMPIQDDLRMIHLENDADNLLHPAREAIETTTASLNDFSTTQSSNTSQSSSNILLSLQGKRTAKWTPCYHLLLLYLHSPVVCVGLLKLQFLKSGVCMRSSTSTYINNSDKKVSSLQLWMQRKSHLSTHWKTIKSQNF